MFKTLVKMIHSPALEKLPWRTVAGVAAFSFGINFFMLAVPIYSLQVYDRVFQSRSMETLIMLTLVVLISLAAVVALDLVRAHVLVRLANYYEQAMSPTVLNACIAGAITPGRPTTGQPLR